MKPFLIFILSIVLLLAFPLCALAQENETSPSYLEKPNVGTESPNPDYGEGFYYYETTSPKTSKDYSTSDTSADILQAVCNIKKVSSGYIRVYGNTMANTVVDEIGYTLYVEVWNGYNWQVIDSFGKKAYNTQTVDRYDYKYVEVNKYYRVRAYHYLKDNGVTKTQTTTSDYIYLD